MLAQGSQQAIDLVCNKYPTGNDSDLSRIKLLHGLKSSIITDTFKTEVDLNAITYCLESSNETPCLEYRKTLLNIIVGQVEKLKAITYLTRVSPGFTSLSRGALYNMLTKNNFELDRLFIKNYRAGNINDFEIALAHGIWLNTFKAMVEPEFNSLNKSSLQCQTYLIQPIIPTMIKYFKAQASYIIKQNPLLSFIPLNKEVTQKSIVKALNKMISYNQKFRKKIEKFHVDHKDNLYTQINLAINDHEMGLLNFSSFAAKYIMNLKDQNKKSDACSSWNAMKALQKKRINTSIGVGFTTALTCSASLFAGPKGAAIGCGPAFVDGVVGAYRGHQFSKLMSYAQYAGQNIDFSQGMTESPFMTSEEASYLQQKGKIIAFANVLGLLPITQGIVKHVRMIPASKRSQYVLPTKRQFAVYPTVDVSISKTELSSGFLANYIGRFYEAYEQNNFQEITTNESDLSGLELSCSNQN